MKSKRQMSGWAAHIVTPRQALITSAVVFLFCLWSFLVVFFGWPRVWAQVVYPFCLFFAPAFAFIAGRELWCSGWNARYFLTLLLAAAGMAFWYATTYFIIHRVTNAD